MTNTKVIVVSGPLAQELPVRHEVAGKIQVGGRDIPATLVCEEGESSDPHGNHVYQEDRAERGPFLVFDRTPTTLKVGEEVTFWPNSQKDLYAPNGVAYTVAEGV